MISYWISLGRWPLALAMGASVLAQPASGDVTITIDTSLAERTLALVCSGARVDEAAIRSSPAVQAQIDHNSGLLAGATMDAYVDALSAASACAAPDPDPFRIARVIAEPDGYRRRADALIARQSALADAVAARLEPYMPDGADFSGSVVLAVPYFSCGGFSSGDRFFVDIACLDEAIDPDAAALELLLAHETYHAIQEQHFFPALEDPSEIATVDDAYEYLFSALLLEGSAEHVASTAALADAEGGGFLTRLFGAFARDNANRLGANFALLDLLLSHVGDASDPRAAAEAAYRAAFSGEFQQFAYYAGARMASDIEAEWGRAALVCVFELPPEQFVLAHDAVAAEAAGEALRLGPASVAAARALGATRAEAADFNACRADDER